MDVEKILDYLTQLEQNNSREWYHAHKEDYQAAYGEFLDVIQGIMLKLGEAEPELLLHEPKELTFKLVRDTRFSKDKSPYLPAFRAHISAKGKLPVPVGYFLVIRPGGRSFLGGGLFADMFRYATEMVRKAIAVGGQEWSDIIEGPAFKSRFQVKGNALKNVPAGYDRESLQAEYLKYKSWFLEYPVADELLLDGDAFIKEAVEVFTAMRPLNDFLNRALVSFEMPKRP